jgi:hypothetical protein
MTEQPMEPASLSGEQYWENQIKRWEASKLTQAEFCRRNGFKSSKFLYWKKKLCNTPNTNISLVQLPMQPTKDAMTGQSIRVLIRNRFQVEIDPGFDPGTLQKLIFTLERL